MIKNFKLKIKNSLAGVTLAEVVVIIFIIVLFSTILIVNFPEIQKRMALSRSAHKLAQDLRRAMDLSLSGVPLADINGDSIAVKGYGIYVGLAGPEGEREYVVYADVADEDGANDQRYSGEQPYILCNTVNQVENGHDLQADCVVEIINLIDENKSLYIKKINNISDEWNGYTSVNFNPPNPIIRIDNRCTSQSCADNPGIGIVLGITGDESAERIVSINTSGTINVQ